MPKFTTKTEASEVVWRAPDGARTIFLVTMAYNGQRFQAKTYSPDIAVVGWSGEVETYEKPGQGGRPTETFVKQPQKEQSFGGGYNRGGSYKGGGAKADPFTMYLSYSKDIAVALIGQGILPSSDSTDGKVFAQLFEGSLTAALEGGRKLYDARPDAPNKAEFSNGEPLPEYKGEATAELTYENLGDIFGGPVVQEGGEMPWQNGQ